jgi:hypothetical protein
LECQPPPQPPQPPPHLKQQPIPLLAVLIQRPQPIEILPLLLGQFDYQIGFPNKASQLALVRGLEFVDISLAQ